MNSDLLKNPDSLTSRDFFIPLPFLYPIFTKQLPTMTNPILLGMLGTNEIIIILVIVLLMFGGRKIPELMKGLGKGVREFNDAKNNVKKEIEESANDVTRSTKD
jgi:sec-independent protein translocase protein TatA